MSPNAAKESATKLFTELVGLDEAVWRDELRDISNQITASCREVDSQSTDQMLEEAHAAAAVLDLKPT